MKYCVRFFGCLAGALSVWGQLSVPQAGYRLPEPLEVAPNQIVMITVTGLNTSTLVSSMVSFPETELAGFRATIRQPRFSPTIVRFLGMKPQACPPSQPNCTSAQTSFTLMMPMELLPDVDATLVLNDRGQDLTPISLRSIPDKIHILNTCDELSVFIGVASEAGGRCLPVVQKQNGRLVSPENPARPGDVLSAWAYGLGFPGAPSGAPNNGPVNVPNPPELLFTYRSEFPGIPLAAATATRPLFAGATGTSGRYQINFEVPANPAGPTIPACDSTFDYSLNVRVRGQSSSDTIRLCVQP